MVARDGVDFLLNKPVLALVEVGAYERLWDQLGHRSAARSRA